MPSSVVVVIVLMSSFYVMITVIPENVVATTLFVGGTGPGNYTKIQDAINASNPGDTIHVYNGTYYERLTIFKPLNLTGEDRDITIIDGGRIENVIYVTADWVNITRFTVSNRWLNFAGIKLDSVRNCHVFDNRVLINGMGIQLHISSNNTISNNSLSYNDKAISLWQSDNNTIAGNDASGNNGAGIVLYVSRNNKIVYNNASSNNGTSISLVDDSDGNVIVNNTIYDNGDGIYVGYTSNNTIASNKMRENGIRISGPSLEHWNTHAIDTSNTVNGKPVYYWKNVTGGTIPPGAGQVILANCTGVTVENQNVSDGSVGIGLGFSSCNTIANNIVSSNNVYGINSLFSHNNTIVNNTLSHSGIGASFYYSSDNVLSGNSASNHWEAFRIYYSDNNIIENNTVFSNAASGFFLDNSNNVTFMKNRVSDNRDGFFIQSSDYNTFSNNTVLSNSDRGIYLTGSDYGTFVDNNLTSNLDGIFLRFSHFGTVTDNTISLSYWAAIFVASSRNTVITNNLMVEDGLFISGNSLEYWNTHTIDMSNTVNGNPVHYWKNITGGTVPSGAGQVILANCTSVTADNQDVSHGSGGIELGFSSSNTVVNNTASHGYIGIYLSNSGNNIISNNTASDNYKGIAVRYSSDNNLLVNNTVLLNHDYGLQLVSSNGNSVYHNDFVDNAPRHASDNTGTNYWDNGYPSGGNYWSDYQGIDNCSGPNQDVCPDPDDIGDTPYSVTFSTVDTYPLMLPVGIVLVRPPIMLGADLSGANLENVTLNWTLSPDDGMGCKSVVEYNVYRNLTFDNGGLGYQLIATLTNGTSSFTDTYAGEGDPNNYFYRVCAVDANNNTTCADDQAGKFTRPLSSGPNLVSVPLIQSNETIGRVLQTVKWDKAWYYDSSEKKWKWHMKFKPYLGELEYFNHSMGVWTNVSEVSNLTVAGLVPMMSTISAPPILWLT